MSLEQLENLEKRITIYDNAYHNLDIELIPDEEYDKLILEYRELLRLHPDYEAKLVPGFIKNPGTVVTITEPMLSIAKFNNWEKFCGLMKRYGDSTIEDKEDGVAVRLVYDVSGNLVYAHIKGNGFEGKDISHRRFLIEGISNTIDNDTGLDVNITGEVTCTKESFDKYMTESGREDAPARSVVSGFLRRDEQADDDGDLPLQFIAFHASKNIRDKFKTYPELTGWLLENGFEVPNTYPEPPKEKPDSIYPIDGIVVKNNNLRLWDDQNFTGYFSYAGCFKYPTELFETKVKGVTWNINTQGYLTGVLNFNPIKIQNTTVSKCTFYYISAYIRNGIAIGSRIQVTKGNEIIPKLISMIEKGNGEKIEFPTECPCCSQKLSEEAEGVYHCDNPQCSGQLTSLLKRAVSECGFDIDGMGDKRIETLVELGSIVYLNQLFDLTVDDLRAAGAAPKVAKTIIAQIKELPKLAIARWIFAAGIPGLGESRCLEIQSYLKENDCETADDLCTILASKDMTDMFGVDGLTVISYTSGNYNDLHDFFERIDFSESRKDNPEYIPISITGKASVERKILKKLFLDKGYWLDNKVTKSSYRLLVGEKPTSGKVGLAERYDIPIVYIEGLDFNGILKQLERH